MIIMAWIWVLSPKGSCVKGLVFRVGPLQRILEEAGPNVRSLDHWGCAFEGDYGTSVASALFFAHWLMMYAVLLCYMLCLAMLHPNGPKAMAPLSHGLEPSKHNQNKSFHLYN